jgi:hypothetical protein
MVEQAAEQLVEGANSTPRALKRGHIFNELNGTGKLVPFPNPASDQGFSATCEAVPNPEPIYETSSRQSLHQGSRVEQAPRVVLLTRARKRRPRAANFAAGTAAKFP